MNTWTMTWLYNELSDIIEDASYLKLDIDPTDEFLINTIIISFNFTDTIIKTQETVYDTNLVQI